jgi:30S ribosomal protein S31
LIRGPFGLLRGAGLLSSAPPNTVFDEENEMGRGDRKTRKGKISIRSYGNARPHAAKKAAGAKPAAAKSPAKTPLKKAAPVKKTVAKKTA